MIKTISEIDRIPCSWIFEHYCNLTEKLHGQNVKILSMFNHKDTQPSMFIYLWNDDRYYFKDFSAGKSGDAIKLVMQLYNLNRYKAINKIIDDYKKNDKPVIIDIKPVPSYKVTAHTKRNWTELDAKYWVQFNIGTSLLNKYNVFPIKEYTFSRNIDNKISEINIDHKYIYGYFKNDGTLYKLYAPYSKQRFVKVKKYIQGTDQLEYKKPNLIITSSLKDIMSLDSLDLNCEFIAPDSENTIISKKIISSYLLKYDNIFTLFDNDDPGHKAMAKYNNEYGIPSIHLNLSKDPSDSIKDFNKTTVKNYINPLIP